MNLETRIYQVLLKLYPRAFRNHYGEEMTRVFQESLRSEGSSFGFWIRTFWDVISSAGRERISGGFNMRNAFVKFGAVCGMFYALFTGWVSIISPMQYSPGLLEILLLTSCFLLLLIAFAVARVSKPHWLEIAGYIALIAGQGLNFSPWAMTLNWVVASLFSFSLIALVLGRSLGITGHVLWKTAPLEAKLLLVVFLWGFIFRLVFFNISSISLLGLDVKSLLEMVAGIGFSVGIFAFSWSIWKIVQPRLSRAQPA